MTKILVSQHNPRQQILTMTFNTKTCLDWEEFSNKSLLQASDPRLT